MKRLGLILLSLIMFFSFGACSGGTQSSNSGNSSSSSSSGDISQEITLEFIQTSGSVTVGGELTLPYRYIVGGVNGNASALTWTTSNPAVATVANGKVTGVSAGTAVITLSADGKEAQYTVTVFAEDEKPKTMEEIIADLIADGYMGTTYTEEGEDPRYADEWQQIQNKKQPLAIGESYTETFETDYLLSRLYPELFVNGAAVSFKDGAEGIDEDGKSLSITTNGDENGNYDAVVFKGFGIEAGARYRITITAKTLNDGRNYYVGFRSDADDVYAFDFSGTEGQTQTVTGVVTVAEKAYNGLVIMIAGGEAAELIIDDLKVERLEKLPVKDVTTIGSSLAFDFEESIDYVSANNSSISHVTGEEAIEGSSLKVTKTASWQGADFSDLKFAENGAYRVSFDIKLLSGSAGQAYATFSSAANGSYQDVGKAISVTQDVTRFKGVYTLKDFNDYYFNFSFSDASCVFVVDNLKIECIDPADIHKMDLTEMNAKYEQNFDEQGLTVDALNYIVAASSVLSLVDNGEGKALQITKTGSWSGMNTQNLILLASGTYRVIFKMKLVSGSTSNMYATFSSAGNGSYQDVGHAIAPTYNWKTFTLDYTLNDYDDYFFNFSFYDASAVVQIDDFSIQRIDPDNRPEIEEDLETTVEVDLTAVGAKYEENFDTLTTDTLANHYMTTGHSTLSLENGALKVTKTAQWQGLKVVNLKMSKDATYKFSFTLNIQQMSSSDFFQVVFADGTAEKVWKDLNTYAKVGESVEVEFELTLLADATEFLIGCWDGGMIYTIDNLTIERIA